MGPSLAIFVVLILCLSLGNSASAQGDADLQSGNWARYGLLSTVERKAPPLAEILITVGPREAVSGRDYRWWELTGKKPAGEEFAIRLLSEAMPMVAEREAPGAVKRYLLREKYDQPIEYVDARTGDALLPKFEFVNGLMPQPMPRPRRENGLCTTGSYLGHVLTLAETGTGRNWAEWRAVTVVRVDPDELRYMYGLARDTEGHYISEGDYTYVPLTREELDELIDLGMNSFTVDDKYEQWVYRRPVLYYKRFSGEARLNYPETLYRSNFRGAVAFIDEPAIHILGDRADLDRIRRPEEGAYLMTKRLDEFWNQPGAHRRTMLREQLQARDVNLGTLTLDDDDHPIWETIIETAFYQLQGGASGMLHEGRFQLDDYINDCEKYLGPGVELSVREMLLLDYAFMRGAARAFDKSWGVAIYGQCDPEIAPVALTLAYDLGARYLWFWTYDHQHHLPHFMKLQLLKHLNAHKDAHPRKSLRELMYAPRTAIVWPYGYGYLLSFDNMWEAKHLNTGYKNAAGVAHREVVAAVMAEAIACAKAGEDFDFVVDIGQDFRGYTRVVKVGLDGQVTDSAPHEPVVKLELAKVEASTVDVPTPAESETAIRIPYRRDLKMDGNLAEWRDANWITLDRENQYDGWQTASGVLGTWGGSEDLSASLAVARDGQCFYVAARIRDDKFFQDKSGEQVWLGDSVQIALDLRLNRGTGYSPDDVEFGLALTPEGPQAYLWKAGEHRDEGVIQEARVVVRRRNNETVYEAALPWGSLTSVDPRLVEYCGMSLLVNDNDGEGRKGYLQLTPGIGKQKDPSAFALARMDAIPAGERDETVVALCGTSRMANDCRRWALTFDTLSVRKTPVEMDLVLERAGRTAADGSFTLEIPTGRSLAVVTIDAGAVRPGTHRCRLVMRANGRELLDEAFRVLLFKSGAVMQPATGSARD